MPSKPYKETPALSERGRGEKALKGVGNREGIKVGRGCFLGGRKK